MSYGNCLDCKTPLKVAIVKHKGVLYCPNQKCPNPPFVDEVREKIADSLNSLRDDVEKRIDKAQLEICEVTGLQMFQDAVRISPKVIIPDEEDEKENE